MISFKIKKVIKFIIKPKSIFDSIKFNRLNPVYKIKGSHNKYKRIYHFHIRKCGGTSLNTAFCAYPDKNQKNYQLVASSSENKAIINNYPIVGWNLKHLKRGDFWYGFSHLEYDKIFPLKKNTFTFSFLRDPVDRVVSHYRMIMEWKNSQIPHPAFKEEGIWLGNSFKDFVHNIPRQHLQNQLFMFSSKFNIEEALKNLQTLDFVGLMGVDEKLFLDVIEKNFNINLDYSHIRKSKYKIFLTDSDKSVLTEKLKEEYIFFKMAKKIIFQRNH